MRTTILAAAAMSVMVPALALAQEPPGQTLPTDTAIPSLMFFTLIAALVIGVGAFAYFLRKRSNRAAAERALDIKDNSKR